MSLWNRLADEFLACPAVDAGRPIREAEVVELLFAIGAFDKVDISSLNENSIFSHFKLKSISGLVFARPAFLHAAGRNGALPHQLLLLLTHSINATVRADPSVLGN